MRTLPDCSSRISPDTSFMGGAAELSEQDRVLIYEGELSGKPALAVLFISHPNRATLCVAIGQEALFNVQLNLGATTEDGQCGGRHATREYRIGSSGTSGGS